jgi:hypothetical protein
MMHRPRRIDARFAWHGMVDWISTIYHFVKLSRTSPIALRNVYTYKIMPEKMKPLAKGIRPLFKQVEKELTGFSRFIQNK